MSWLEKFWDKSALYFGYVPVKEADDLAEQVGRYADDVDLLEQIVIRLGINDAKLVLTEDGTQELHVGLAPNPDHRIVELLYARVDQLTMDAPPEPGEEPFKYVFDGTRNPDPATQAKLDEILGRQIAYEESEEK